MLVRSRVHAAAFSFGSGKLLTHSLSAVEFSALPVAALVVRDDVIVAVNSAYEALFGLSADQAIGRNIREDIASNVLSVDMVRVEETRTMVESGERPAGTLKLRIVDSLGRTRALRVEWVPRPEPGTSMVFLVEEERDERIAEFTGRLTRASSEFMLLAEEREILTRSVDALVEFGFAARILLLNANGTGIVPDSIRRRVATMGPFAFDQRWREASLSLEVAKRMNPRFEQGRAAFFLDGAELFENLVQPLPDSPPVAHVRCSAMQLPIIVNGAVFGIFIVAGEAVVPGFIGPFELFGAFIGRAIESGRMRVQNLERERLAALGEAAAVMAHEVRNPIAAIVNAVTLLQREAAPREALLTMIAEESERLERIVSDLLVLGRRLVPQLVPTSLHALGDAACKLLVARGGAGDIPIEVLDTGQGWALVDPDLMSMAVLNVLQNAVQASPADGRVRVSVESREGVNPAVALCIDDEGDGFSINDLGRVFEPFFTTRPAGTGVGLAVVRRLVEACGGQVEISSRRGFGARVALVFPETSMRSVE